ncbi:MAG: hypothetical protein WCP17_03820 [bacterium]
MGMENVPQINTEVEEFESNDSKLNPDEALSREKSILDRFKGKAKSVARIMLLVSALSAGGGVVNEVYAQENKPSTNTEQIQKGIDKEIIKEFTFKQKVYEGGKLVEGKEGHEFKIEFKGEVEKTLKDQNVIFDDKKGEFYLVNDKEKAGSNLVIGERDGVWTNKVEVSIENFKIPGSVDKDTTTIKIKSFNSDNSIEIISVVGGRVAGYSVEKPNK